MFAEVHQLELDPGRHRARPSLTSKLSYRDATEVVVSAPIPWASSGVIPVEVCRSASSLRHWVSMARGSLLGPYLTDRTDLL